MRVLNSGNFALGFTTGGLIALLTLLTLDFFRVGLSEGSFSTLIGAMIGATIALIGTIIVAAQAKQIRDEDRKFSDSATLHSILAKLIDFNDELQKTKRHFMIYDRSARVFLQGESGEVSFSKPLEGLWRLIEFSVSERTFLLRIQGGEFFNLLSDANGISETFHVLRERHKQAYYALLEEVVAGEWTREGYLMTSGIKKDSHNLMIMMDIDGALRSLLENSSGPVEGFLGKIIALSNEMTERKILYEIADNPPAAENSLRQKY